MPDMNTVLALSNTYAGLQNIPADVLEQHELVRMMHQGLVRIVPKSTIRLQATRVAPLLAKYKGYFSATDYESLAAMRDGKVSLNDKTIARAVGRAKAFKEAGIPPIFDIEHFGMSAGAHVLDKEKEAVIGITKVFATADFIIQYAAGVYEGRRAARMMSAKRTLGKAYKKATVAIWPCTVDDVQRFCSVAFDENGSIVMPLIREVLYHASSSFRFRTPENEERALRNTERTFAFLEQTLRPLAFKAGRSYQVWDGNVQVVEEPRWYLVYAPADHDRIAAAYFASLQAVPVGAQRRIFERTAAIFPELAPTMENLWALGLMDAVESALKYSDFLYLPRSLFSPDNEDRRVYDAALKHFTALCSKWAQEKDPIVLEKTVYPSRAACIPIDVLRRLEFRTFLSQARMTVVQSLTDEQFAEAFRNSDGRFVIGGFGLGVDGDEVGKQLHEYLNARVRDFPG
jgi:hypothetical protein